MTDGQSVSMSWCRVYSGKCYNIISCQKVAVWKLRPYFTVSSETSPNLEGQAPVFISLRNRVVQLYPRALSCLYVTSYILQGYSWNILTRLHTGITNFQNHLMQILWYPGLTVEIHMKVLTSWNAIFNKLFYQNFEQDFH
jgi:hypothetical protein